MKQSLIKNDKPGICHLCGMHVPTEKHHIFGGANRGWSEEYGLFVHLCHRHHNEPPGGVHFDPELMRTYHQIGQACFERSMTERGKTKDEARAEFMRIFGRNYL